MDPQEIKTYYNRCRPYEALMPNDPRNVDMDGAVDGFQARGRRWAHELCRRFGRSDEPTLKLFTGLPGSGKTTELLRLIHLLEQGTDLFPVYIKAEDILDLSSPIDPVDVLMAVIYEAERAVLLAEGKDPEDAMKNGYLKRCWDWLRNTDVEFGKTQYSESGARFFVEMKTQPTFRQKVRAAATSHFSRFQKEIIEGMDELLERVRKRGKVQMVVVFDSLEKLRGLSSTWHDVLESAEQLFSQGAPYLQMPVHALFTVPAALATRIAGIEFLPMIKVRHKNGDICQDGLEIARKLITQRIPENAIQHIFGDMARLDQIILKSAGYPREIVKMAQDALAGESFPISDREYNRVLTNLDNEYRMVVAADSFSWLAKVAKSQWLIVENDEHRLAADRMLSNHAVMCYLNDELWYDLHPSVKNIPEVKGLIESLDNGNGATS